MLKKWIITGVASMVLLSSCSKDVATFKGGSITMGELDAKAQMALHELKEREFEIKRDMAYQMALDKILALEGEKTKKDKNALVDAYIKKNSQPIDDIVLKGIYDQNRSLFKGTFAEEKDNIQFQIGKQQREALTSQYYRSLFDQYSFKFELEEPAAPAVEIEIGDDPVIGNKDAKVVIVEFTDYECPYCRKMQPDAEQIKKEYGNKLAWVVKDFPLDFHPASKKAHMAANCAKAQGKFYEYHTELFRKGQDGKMSADVSPERLDEIAKSIGLDYATFTACWEDKDGKIAREIGADIEYGVGIGVRGTPSIFINGKRVKSWQYPVMKEAIDKEMK